MRDVQDPMYRKIKEKLPEGMNPAEFIASVRVHARKAT
jgi:hypothetical protein